MPSISPSLRSRIVSILLATVLFTVLVGLQALVAQRSFGFGVLDGALIGCGVGLFEEFYVQSQRGRWLRSMHPIQSMLCYVAFVMWLAIFVLLLTHSLLGGTSDLLRVYTRLPVLVPLFLAIAFIGVSLIRVAHFTGTDVLFHLLVGTYYRPRLEAKVILFLDMNARPRCRPGSASSIPPLWWGSSSSTSPSPITEHGGSIYLYKGDGLIALWDSGAATRGHAVLRAVDAIHAAIERSAPALRRQFDVVPSFRIGIHGGEVVVSEQGDLRRGIGIFGEVINVAARMEEAARVHRVMCVLSEEIALAFDPTLLRFRPLGEEVIKGLPAPIRICEYRPKALATTTQVAEMTPAAAAKAG